MKKIYIIGLIFIFLAPFLFAHPHLYIDISVSLKMDNEGIVGFYEEWILGGNFGANIGVEYDENLDGKFNAEETIRIKEEIFDNIKKYNYYTYLETANGVFFPEEVRDFAAIKKEGSTIFRFFVPCRIYAGNTYETFELTVHDLSRYVSFGLLYFDDPYSSTIDYNVSIVRDGDYYSHSCTFGNAVFIIKMKLKEEGQARDSTDNNLEGMVKLSEPNNFLRNTISNPFLGAGNKIKDENANPFLGK